MKEEVKNLSVKSLEELGVNDDVKQFIEDLLEKAIQTNEKTKQNASVVLSVADDHYTYCSVDDYKLLYVGCALLPNIVNYLVNILPQFIYPYVVAYLQDLSSMREDPFTINELFDIVRSIQFSD